MAANKFSSFQLNMTIID